MIGAVLFDLDGVLVDTFEVWFAVVPRPKPAPDMVLAACELLGVAPTEAVMVGDSSYDRDAARAAGVRFIGFRCAGDAKIETLVELLPALGMRIG